MFWNIQIISYFCTMNNYANKYGSYVIPQEIEYTYNAKTIMNGGVHEEVTIEFIKSYKTIIHAGTGFGDFLPALKDCERVFAFEPNMLMSECALKTIELNNLTNVQLCNLALGDVNSYCSLNHIDSKGREMGPRTEVGRYGSDCQMITLDSYIPVNVKIDLIHLDTEGYELKILEGTKRLIEKDRPVIVLEIDARAVEYNEYMENIGYQTHKQLIYNSNEDMVFVNTVYIPKI